MIAKLMAVCVALMLLGGTVQAASFAVTAPAPSMVELDDRPAEVAVPVEPVLVPLIRHGLAIEMPPITQLITYVFAARMDRPPRN